jgi:hypothetical protein
MKHGVLTNARLVHESCRRGGFRTRAAMVTLTYRPGEVWNPRHISETLAAARKWHNRLGQKMRYVWVAEMQERGAVHYHVIFWMQVGYKLPLFDRRGWWPYGKTNAEWARNGVGYVAKYASKGADGPAFPKGIRINGAGGLDVPARIEARYWRAPQECRLVLGAAADIRRISGGRFDAVTGQFWQTPWRMLRINGDFYMTKTEIDHEA